MKEGIEIAGWGAVSPAGWSATDLRQAVLNEVSLTPDNECRVQGAPIVQRRPVPPLTEQPPWLRLPRLRRSSPITRYAVAAVMQALLQRDSTSSSDRLGVIFTVQNGSVNYSRKFYAEVMENPELASPILFPETVFNAPSSHISHLLNAHGPNTTLVQDSAGFLNGLDLAAHWLDSHAVDECIVVAAEEYDWLSAEALTLFPAYPVVSDGAAAVWLRRVSSPQAKPICLLKQITSSRLWADETQRAEAIRLTRLELESANNAIKIDALSGLARLDAPHHLAYQDWSGPCYSIHPTLGHAFAVTAGWQCVLACELLALNPFSDEAVVVADAGSHQTIALSLQRG